MRRPASELLRWSAVDPFIAGPYAGTPGPQERPLEVPPSYVGELRFGRIVSGPGWPSELHPIDRLAAVPRMKRDRLSPVAERDVVLYFEAVADERVPLCAKAGGEASRWNVHPVEWIRQLLSEAYVQKWVRPLPSRIPFVNYSRIPNALKRALQRLQDPVSGYGSQPLAFPSVPLDWLVETLRELCHVLAGASRGPNSALWPDGRSAAVTLTHDVDTPWILEPEQPSLLREILEMESSLGLRGAWYLTAQPVDRRRHEAALDLIREAGHEIGAHGWNHDAKLEYLRPARQETRLRRIGERFSGLEIEGIRTPWYCRSASLYAVLARHFVYDSSVPNASGFFSSGSNSGCCSIFPFRTSNGMFELPMTLPPDTALHPVDGYERQWEPVQRIVERGGVVVVTLHPQPHQSARERELARYYGFLRRLVDTFGERLWHATPRDIVRRYSDAVPPRASQTVS